MFPTLSRGCNHLVQSIVMVYVMNRRLSLEQFEYILHFEFIFLVAQYFCTY